MTWDRLAGLLLCAFGAEVVGTMAGFGAATILTPVAALFLEMKSAIALVAVFHLFGNASRLVFFGRSIHWKTWSQFGVVAITCSVLGAWLTAGLSSELIKRLFGAFLLLYVAVSVGASSRWQLPSTPAMLIGGGALSGFIAGLLGTGGAIRSACLLAFGLAKEVYIGTSAAIALVVDATRLPIYLAGSFIPMGLVPVVVALVPVAFVGSWVGQQLVQRVSAGRFRQFVLMMLAAMGVKFLWGA
jgi:uncharacterized membrane protein YfcA